MRSRPHVVLDTNVVLSALLFGGGAPGELRRAWQRVDFVPLASTDTMRELIRVLAYPKFALTAAERDQLLSDYLPVVRSVQLPVQRPRLPACRDPFDQPFLELAAAGKADALVSGDRDLLALSGATRFAILTPAAFLEQLRERKR